MTVGSAGVGAGVAVGVGADVGFEANVGVGLGVGDAVDGGGVGGATSVGTGASDGVVDVVAGVGVDAVVDAVVEAGVDGVVGTDDGAGDEADVDAGPGGPRRPSVVAAALAATRGRRARGDWVPASVRAAPREGAAACEWAAWHAGCAGARGLVTQGVLGDGTPSSQHKLHQRGGGRDSGRSASRCGIP